AASADHGATEPANALIAFRIPQIMYRWYESKAHNHAEARNLRAELDDLCRRIHLTFSSDEELESAMLPTGYGSLGSAYIENFPAAYADYFDLGNEYLLAILFIRDRENFERGGFDWRKEWETHKNF